MHGVRRKLLEQQVKSIGLPLKTIELPQEPGMEEYNLKMKEAVRKLKKEGFTAAAFGDIFLEDLRAYRIKQLEQSGIQTYFPIWQRDTKSLIGEFIDSGFKAVVVCIKSDLLDASFAGREIDEGFLKDLPSNVDACGENGEFHTFCYDGPIFSKPIEFTLGEKTYREYKAPKDEVHQKEQTMGFWFCDLLPVEKN